MQVTFSPKHVDSRCINSYESFIHHSFIYIFIHKLIMFFGLIGLNRSALQSFTGKLQGRITYREVPVVITGNRYAEYNFCRFWLHNFPVIITLKLVL